LETSDSGTGKRLLAFLMGGDKKFIKQENILVNLIRLFTYNVSNFGTLPLKSP
jgi:hypothetical protein